MLILVSFQQDKAERNILVFDLGGGTTDVSILTIADGVYEVRSTAGNLYLGGENFTNELVDFVLKEFGRLHNYGLQKIVSNPRIMARLRYACEDAKMELSNVESTHVIVQTQEGTEFPIAVTRADFETINAKNFHNALVLIQKVGLIIT